mmetsp:Transcript_5145/g.13369  ORF Transcript_5145/g.13369 Transcript_5145/m.13369 type:complete len:100 (+) Transcript_5145:387-686(+)|eukprot:CAMPEP_0182915682 /NCGR_PEP_ID=MMETSP0105_2-20130417/478_1 /TAXON_ID=81532 ORGANISM="Acanthoeca-like sp., Strain 10tr" /NCGR_SAMPLE_ID=MMETSP0105_2 /ASSEMBLY_ACC=CAM_ASM_000205 /LENGTH=99 /DNA_ID=CAMNT_0025052563 /DNA_START=57 /DNA_END=356 /DNA_ORIENTATION=+
MAAPAARTIYSGKGSFLRMLKTNPEVMPLAGAVTFAVTFATYAIYHSATRPDVVWGGRQDAPWQRVQQGRNTKWPFAKMPNKKDVPSAAAGEDLRGKFF